VTSNASLLQAHISWRSARHRSRSHNSDATGNLKSFLVGRESNVGLLLAVGTHQGVNSSHLDFVEHLARLFDGWLLGASVRNEHECVVLLDGLDGALAAEGELDDGIGVKGLVFLDTDAEGKGCPLLRFGGGLAERGLGPHFAVGVLVDTLLHSFSSFFSNLLNT
jgi:hypothetical protein